MKKIASIREDKYVENFIKLGIDSFIISYSAYSSCNYKTNKQKFASLIKKIHRLHKEVIVRLDCLYEENQLEDIKKFLLYLQILKVEYVMLSDVAVKIIIDENNINIKTIYAAETLLTNKYDIEQIKNDNFSGCVISKNIPFTHVLNICNAVSNYCYLTVSGPILMSYSRRRFISTYLGKTREYQDGYYLSEENRNLKMPIVEKKNGTWFYYCSLDSLNEYETIFKSPFKGIIFDNSFYCDEYSLNIIKIYEEMSRNNDYDLQYKKMRDLDNDIEYLNIDDIKLSQLDKD